MDIQANAGKAEVTSKLTDTEQSIHIEAEQLEIEQTPKFETTKQHHTKANKSYEECDIASKTSLEIVSPKQKDDKVILIILAKYELITDTFQYTF